MATVFFMDAMDGVNLTATNRMLAWRSAVTTGGATITRVPGGSRTGHDCHRSASANLITGRFLTREGVNPGTTWCCGANVFVGAGAVLTSAANIFGLNTGGAAVYILQRETDGSVRLVESDGTTEVARSAAGVWPVDGNWLHVEFEVEQATNGFIRVRIEGELVLDASFTGAPSAWASMALYFSGRFGESGTVTDDLLRISDFYFSDVSLVAEYNAKYMVVDGQDATLSTSFTDTGDGVLFLGSTAIIGVGASWDGPTATGNRFQCNHALGATRAEITYGNLLPSELYLAVQAWQFSRLQAGASAGTTSISMPAFSAATDSRANTNTTSLAAFVVAKNLDTAPVTGAVVNSTPVELQCTAGSINSVWVPGMTVQGLRVGESLVAPAGPFFVVATICM